MQSLCKSYVTDPGHSMNILTSTMLTNYLEKLRVIRCKDQLYLKVIEE